MLSREDSRRLAQLERQLLRDDPDFCARMREGQSSPAGHRRAPVVLMVGTVALYVMALILAVAGWWIPAAVSALGATMTAAAAAHRLIRSRAPGR
ncbi:DUF3040 domain-containing protein [Paractinoplanes rishiriensis]|uniref:DUF3040 domain-containing protein n=1 Tax=Paractinoplanes rishiriensis TaxID=1050105 RepID=A0A919JYW3_9ACTN|nr:DUF3040 domain-containing protein [Actinoplanes rishiriensis]GIE96224.1 hypothetical protein Ari01nite_36890 [Actinoplanes rishiriensis]